MPLIIGRCPQFYQAQSAQRLGLGRPWADRQRTAAAVITTSSWRSDNEIMSCAPDSMDGPDRAGSQKRRSLSACSPPPAVRSASSCCDSAHTNSRADLAREWIAAGIDRRSVVDGRRRLDVAHLQAGLAQRVRLQLGPPQPLPSLRCVGPFRHCAHPIIASTSIFGTGAPRPSPS